MNLIRAHQDDMDADEVITARTGYSKAFIAALRADSQQPHRRMKVVEMTQDIEETVVNDGD